MFLRQNKWPASGFPNQQCLELVLSTLFRLTTVSPIFFQINFLTWTCSRNVWSSSKFCGIAPCRNGENDQKKGFYGGFHRGQLFGCSVCRSHQTISSLVIPKKRMSASQTPQGCHPSSRRSMLSTVSTTTNSDAARTNSLHPIDSNLTDGSKSTTAPTKPPGTSVSNASAATATGLSAQPSSPASHAYGVTLLGPQLPIRRRHATNNSSTPPPNGQ